MTPTDLTATSPEPDQRTERVRRLLGALYREEARAAAYRAFRRRATEEPLQKMLDTYLQVETRFIGVLERHLAELGVGRPGRRGILRRALRGLGGVIGVAIAWRGNGAILRAREGGRMERGPALRKGDRLAGLVTAGALEPRRPSLRPAVPGEPLGRGGGSRSPAEGAAPARGS
jgi:hypothetical protein